MQFLATFDGPNVLECYRRTESVMPQQALAMANSRLVLAQSRLAAKVLSSEERSRIAKLAAQTRWQKH